MTIGMPVSGDAPEIASSGATTGAIGLLYPGRAAEDDYPLLARLVSPQVRAEVVHTSVGEDAHRVDALLDLGADERLVEGARRLAGLGVQAAMWACTSGSFVFGWEGARAQAATVAEAVGVPASSTSFAFVAALRHIGARRVAVVATYPRDVAARFEALLVEAGATVSRLTPLEIPTAAEAGELHPEQVVAAVRDGDHPSAEVLLVPDTALHTASYLPDLESAVGKPVITANQVTFWCGLGLAGILRPQDRLGALFRLDAPRDMANLAEGSRQSASTASSMAARAEKS